jgi:hypothetical protein
MRNYVTYQSEQSTGLFGVSYSERYKYNTPECDTVMCGNVYGFITRTIFFKSPVDYIVSYIGRDYFSYIFFLDISHLQSCSVYL